MLILLPNHANNNMAQLLTDIITNPSAQQIRGLYQAGREFGGKVGRSGTHTELLTFSLS